MSIVTICELRKRRQDIIHGKLGWRALRFLPEHGVTRGRTTTSYDTTHHLGAQTYSPRTMDALSKEDNVRYKDTGLDWSGE